MVKIPRDISGNNLCKLLEKYGYKITKQTGSHIRLTCKKKDKIHHITIPNHSSIKIGTLNKIIKEIAKDLKINKEEFLKELFK